MAKRTLKFDIGKLTNFLYFYEQVTVIEPNGDQRIDWDLVLSTRGKKNIKNKTAQSQTNAGQFDFYQVYNFVIRDRSTFEVKKDMIIYCDSVLYVIHGFAPMENNPNYIEIYCNTINDDNHELWTIINSMPIDSDKDTIIDAG